MSDPFGGFVTAVAAAAKPDFDDVIARSTRYRRRGRSRWFAAIAATILTAGGGTALGVAAGRGTPDPSPTAGVAPWRTTVARNAPGPLAPREYRQTRPDFWVPVGSGDTLTGLQTQMRAGDVDHLYLQYQKCGGDGCHQMLASTTDRGKTWHKFPLPAPISAIYKQAEVTDTIGGMVVALSAPRVVTAQRLPVIWASPDAGATWHRTRVDTGATVPFGWRVQPTEAGLVAIDPATGDGTMYLSSQARFSSTMVMSPQAGIWWMDAGKDALDAEVSRDGGRSWYRYPLPLPRGAGLSTIWCQICTGDGRLVYVTRMHEGLLHLWASVDGAVTWEDRATLDADGPVVSVLPVDDRTVILQGAGGSFRSTDQGRTFVRVGPRLGHDAYRLGGGGFMIATDSDSDEFSAWVSADGADWTFVHRPEVP
ncbi:hypothetical protein ACWT_6763 [Actinoplanes sp. SE50]|uniref:sialidase family protein n=1 Tax=unclassified Actinoplanes TaxID=2626549 RepID=UPI00023ECF60|nr:MULTISPECIES: sialidase family protein [unclassified Actinoplanes]AEV87776.1 hypothetical protein ACPL_6894 [Actinoplanes sp. SE50/110]ATO86178.1 hypothetical protein ACWT_6763 [Actinoplanes sp. SE50]SLM03592.1 hypothetical protein ACSP50_6885 [Actinoplanes sp. SE50/110]